MGLGNLLKAKIKVKASGLMVNLKAILNFYFLKNTIIKYKIKLKLSEPKNNCYILQNVYNFLIS